MVFNKLQCLSIYDDCKKKYQHTILPTSINHDKHGNIIEDKVKIDYSKPVLHMLYDKCVRFRENKDRDWIDYKSFYDENGDFKLYFTDVYVEPYLISEVDIYENHGFKGLEEDGSFYEIYEDINNSKNKDLKPKLCITYSITDKKPYRKFEYFDMKRKDIQFTHKFDEFSNEIVFYFEPVIYTCKSKIYEDMYCGVESLVSGSSEVKMNGKKYLFDTKNIYGIYCLKMDRNYRTFLCIVELETI